MDQVPVRDLAWEPGAIDEQDVVAGPREQKGRRRPAQRAPITIASYIPPGRV
jgi:hypothetical protein